MLPVDNTGALFYYLAMPDEKRPFLRSVHYFRAFAIVNIMLVHVWNLPESANPGAFKLVETLRELLFHDTTIYFLFVSGFLFSYLSDRFDVWRYYRNKLSFVVAPYLLITIALMAKSQIPEIASGRFDLPSFLPSLLVTIVLGLAQYQYWYIPFLVTLFLISPLLRRIPARIHLPLALVALALPLLGTRTSTLLTFGLYLYFLPVYLLGMLAGANRVLVAKWTRKLRPVLIVLVVSSFAVLAACDHMIGRFNLFESVQYVNKICLTFLVLERCSGLEDRNLPILNLLADFSFALYFVHFLFDPLLQSAFYGPLLRAMPFLSATVLLIPLSLIYSVLRMALSLAVCMALKRVLGRFSRYVIGA